MQCIVHHHRHIRICIVVLVDLQFCKTWCSKPLLTAISVFLVLKLHGLLQFFANAQRRQRKIGTLVVSEKYPFTGFENYQKCLIFGFFASLTSWIWRIFPVKLQFENNSSNWFGFALFKHWMLQFDDFFKKLYLKFLRLIFTLKIQIFLH